MNNAPVAKNVRTIVGLNPLYKEKKPEIEQNILCVDSFSFRRGRKCERGFCLKCFVWCLHNGTNVHAYVYFIRKLKNVQKVARFWKKKNELLAHKSWLSDRDWCQPDESVLSEPDQRACQGNVSGWAFVPSFFNMWTSVPKKGWFFPPDTLTWALDFTTSAGNIITQKDTPPIPPHNIVFSKPATQNKTKIIFERCFTKGRNFWDSFFVKLTLSALHADPVQSILECIQSIWDSILSGATSVLHAQFWRVLGLHGCQASRSPALHAIEAKMMKCAYSDLHLVCFLTGTSWCTHSWRTWRRIQASLEQTSAPDLWTYLVDLPPSTLVASLTMEFYNRTMFTLSQNCRFRRTIERCDCYSHQLHAACAWGSFLFRGCVVPRFSIVLTRQKYFCLQHQVERYSCMAVPHWTLLWERQTIRAVLPRDHAGFAFAFLKTKI